MFAVNAGNRHRAITRGAHWNKAHGLITDMAVHIAIDDVL